MQYILRIRNEIQTRFNSVSQPSGTVPEDNASELVFVPPAREIGLSSGPNGIPKPRRGDISCIVIVEAQGSEEYFWVRFIRFRYNALVPFLKG